MRTRDVVGGRPKIYRGNITGGTPVVLSVYDDLGRYATKGHVQNMSETVDLRAYFSNDETNYNGGQATSSTEYYLLKAYGAGSIVSASVAIDQMQLKSIKLDCAAGETGAYQVLVF